jgi:hypothetical protein
MRLARVARMRRCERGVAKGERARTYRQQASKQVFCFLNGNALSVRGAYATLWEGCKGGCARTHLSPTSKQASKQLFCLLQKAEMRLARRVCDPPPFEKKSMRP